MDENLYLIEALVQGVVSNYTEVCKKDLCVDITLGRIATFAIKFENASNAACGNNALDPNPGKSYLFPASAYVLQHQMEDSEITFIVKHISTGALIGNAVLQWPKQFIRLVKESKTKKNEVEPVIYNDTIKFFDTNGEVKIFFRLSCFGNNIETQYQVVQSKNASMSYLFKGTNVPTAFRTDKYGQGGLQDLLPLGPLYSQKKRDPTPSEESLELTPSEIEERLCGQDDCIAAYQFKKFGIGHLAHPKLVPPVEIEKAAPCGGPSCPYQYEVNGPPCEGLHSCSFTIPQQQLERIRNPKCLCGGCQMRAAGGTSTGGPGAIRSGTNAVCNACPNVPKREMQTQSPDQWPCGKPNCGHLVDTCEKGGKNCKNKNKRGSKPKECIREECSAKTKSCNMPQPTICDKCGGYSISGKTCKDLPPKPDHYSYTKPEIKTTDSRCGCSKCAPKKDAGCSGDIHHVDNSNSADALRSHSAGGDISHIDFHQIPSNQRLKSGGNPLNNGHEPTVEEKARKKCNLVYNMGENYPGNVIGHKKCVLPAGKIPCQQGWAWKPEPTCGTLKGRRKYKPGFIDEAVEEIIREQRKVAGLAVTEKKAPPKKKPRKGARTVATAAADDGDEEPEYVVDERQTLNVQKKEGAYIITMNPLREPKKVYDNEDPYLNMLPLMFKISKPQKTNLPDTSSASCDCCDCFGDEPVSEKSSEGSINIDFSPPPGIIDMEKMKKHPNVSHFWTQYDLTDIGLTPPKPAGKGKGKK